MKPFDTAEAHIGAELPSPTRQAKRRSYLNITTTLNPLTTPFCPSPTPKSASFPSLPSFSKPPPAIPPKWLWRCHICGSSYYLGTTRRCLNDGHYFCAGTTINRKTGRRRNHAPCGSTFDYIGWQEYGDWRRNEQNLRAKPRSKSAGASATPSPSVSRHTTHGCARDCNFPSECRWSSRLSLSPDSPSRKSTMMETPPSPEIEMPDAPASQVRSGDREDIPSKEFQLNKSSARRKRSFSLPFSQGGNADVDTLSNGADGTVQNGADGEERLWILPAK